MPRWEWLLGIMVLAEMVWILSSLFRGSEEERRGPGQRPGARRGDSPANRQKPTASNVDRFLEEINRRRREAAERQGLPMARELASGKNAPRKAPRTESPERRQVGEPLPSSVARQRIAIAAASSSQSRGNRSSAEPILVRQDASLVAAPISQAGALSAPEVVIVSQPAPEAAAIVQPRSAPRPAFNQLLPLLGTKRGLQAAVVLHEIFGPPRCRRPRRHSSST